MIPDTLPIEKLRDPVQSARAVGLQYVTDEMPGIYREGSHKHFRFRGPNGKMIRDRHVLARIESLAIPPAWTRVWICPDAQGHLQATGRDARGRKQHRYHPRWREIRDETKYIRMISFVRALPRIRRRVRRDLKRPDLPREKVLAAVVRLLEVSLIRVGNDEYARENDSFGLTTMRNYHVKINGSELRFRFRGKSGKWHEVDICDRRLAKIVKRCQDLPGQELFQYRDEQGNLQDVRSGDVNDYLREIGGQEFTAKEFRTWAGTLLGAMALKELEQFESQAQAKKNIVQAVASVAERLGNTPAVCRKCYLHPDVIDAYLDGPLVKILKKRPENEWNKNLANLHPEEAAVLGLLRRRLAAEKRRQMPLRKLLRKSLLKVKKAQPRADISIPGRFRRWKTKLSPVARIAAKTAGVM